MIKNRIITKKQARREAYIKGIITGMIAVGAVFAAPKLIEAYRMGQREQLAQLKAEENERRLQAEFEADKEATIRAEREEARRIDQEEEASQKRIQAKIKQDADDLKRLWENGIYPENNEDAYCGRCAACKARDAGRE